MTSQEILEALYQKLGKLLEGRKEYYTDKESRTNGGRFQYASTGSVDHPVLVTLRQMEAFVTDRSSVVNDSEVVIK